MRKRDQRLVLALTVAALVVLSPSLAVAEDSPDITKLAGFVRWTGLLFSVPVTAGAPSSCASSSRSRRASAGASRTAGP